MEVPHAFSLYRALSVGTYALLLGDPFRDAQTARLIELAEAVSERQGLSKAVKARLAFVLVEAFQNIIRHRPPVRGPEAFSTFLFLSGPSGQQVITRNPVAVQDLPPLRSALAGVQGRTADELKALFLQGLQSNATTAKGGAGLGLIEMTRRSGRDLVHDMVASDEGLHRFTLQVLLGDAAPLQAGQVNGVCDLQQRSGVLAAMCGEADPALTAALLGLAQESGPLGERLLIRLAQAAQLLEATSAMRRGAALLCVQRRGGHGWSVLLGSTWDAADAVRIGAAIAGGQAPADMPALEAFLRAGATASRHGQWPMQDGTVFVWVEVEP